MQINTINNYGGNQQFADSIINHYPNAALGQNEIELLKFIAEVKAEEASRQALGQDVAVVNDSAASTADQDSARRPH